MKRMGMSACVEVGSRAENLGMDRPFAVTHARAAKLLAVEIDENEIARIEELAQRNLVALQPEAAPVGIAQRDVPKDAIAMAVELQNPTAPRELIEFLAQRGARRFGN